MAEEEAQVPKPVPDWLRLQEKIFTRYVNQKFREAKSEMKVSNIKEDVKDGLILIDLLEIMSGKSFPDKKPKPGKSRIQQIDNCVSALNFAKKDCAIKTDAAAENLVDGDEKPIFSLIFQIIIKYMKLDEDDDAATDVREALILWLRNKLQAYPSVVIDDKNLTKSFHDGLAFCALIHKMRPKLIPFDTLTPEDKLGNLALALNTAAKYCNVERYLEPEDISKLDDLGMIVYLYDWYYGIALLAKQDAGARRIGKLIVMTQRHDRMKAEYTERASALVAWISAKIAELDDHSFDNTLEGIKAKLAAFYEYKASQKSTKLTEHMDIEALFNDLALRLENNKRPPFAPADGLAPADLLAKLAALEASENSRNEAMLRELARQNRLDKLAKRFASDAAKFSEWLAEKEKYLAAKEAVDSIAQAQLHLNVLASYKKEYENVRATRLASLKALLDDLVGDNYFKKAEVEAHFAKVEGQFTALQGPEAAKLKTLEDDLARERHKEKLRMDFASAATDLEQYCNDQVDFVSNAYFGDTLEAVTAYEATLTSTGAAISGSAAEKLAATDAIWAEIQQYAITENNYTALTKDALHAAVARLTEALGARKAAYAAELARQQANDALCQDFAAKAKAFSEWLSGAKASASDKSKELEAQLSTVTGLIAARAEAEAKLAELDATDAKILAAEIISNKYTNITSNDAKTSYEQFFTSLGKRKDLLETEIANKQQKGVSGEQLKEIEDNFRHFDKDSSGFLEKREFRACLQSLGQDASPADVKAALAQYDKDLNGKISFSEFIDFMIKRLGDTDSKEEILDAFNVINQKEYAVPELLSAVVNETTFKDEYVDYLKKEMSPQEDGLNFKKWTEEVFAR